MPSFFISATRLFAVGDATTTEPVAGMRSSNSRILFRRCRCGLGIFAPIMMGTDCGSNLSDVRAGDFSIRSTALLTSCVTRDEVTAFEFAMLTSVSPLSTRLTNLRCSGRSACSRTLTDSDRSTSSRGLRSPAKSETSSILMNSAWGDPALLRPCGCDCRRWSIIAPRILIEANASNLPRPSNLRIASQAPTSPT